MANNAHTLAAIILGVVGLAGLFVIMSKTCKFCNAVVQRGSNKCLRCGSNV